MSCVAPRGVLEAAAGSVCVSLLCSLFFCFMRELSLGAERSLHSTDLGISK